MERIEEQDDNPVARLISSGTPSAIGKIGGVEGKCLEFMALPSIYRRLRPDKARRLTKMLYDLAGGYPQRTRTLEEFADYWRLHVLPNVDILSNWRGAKDELIKRHYNAPATLIPVKLFDLIKRPSWPSALNHKRVLVVSPFKHSILSQREKLADIWKGTFRLDNVDLVDVVAPPVHAHLIPPRTPNWFVQLGAIWSEMQRHEYDVVLIGAGAWGLPLAVLAKSAGKVGIHTGGVTQLLFGVMGKRWSEHGEPDYMNENWIYPDERDVPPNLHLAPKAFRDDATYWRTS